MADHITRHVVKCINPSCLGAGEGEREFDFDADCGLHVRACPQCHYDVTTGAEWQEALDVLRDEGTVPQPEGQSNGEG